MNILLDRASLFPLGYTAHCQVSDLLERREVHQVGLARLLLSWLPIVSPGFLVLPAGS